MLTPVLSARALARFKATSEISTPVTTQPKAASRTAFLPAPIPQSSAVPTGVTFAKSIRYLLGGVPSYHPAAYLLLRARVDHFSLPRCCLRIEDDRSSI